MSIRYRLALAAVSMMLAGTTLAEAPPQPLPQVRPAQAIRPGAVPQLRPTTDIQRCVAAGGEDCDGDGAKSTVRGGSDCDDTDPLRYPGSPEVADFEGHDEDCDPRTIGAMDLDGDGFHDRRVFNRDGGRGEDCDDRRRWVHPGAAELPNRIDDDCDGAVDNLVGEWWSPGGAPPQ